MAARIEAHSAERRELAQALLEWVTAARRDPGALGAHVYEDLEAPSAFCAISRWESRVAFDAHLRGTPFGIVLGALELLAGPPLLGVANVADGTDTFLTLRHLRDLRRAGPPCNSSTDPIVEHHKD